MKLIAQLLGVGAMLSLFLIYQQRSRRRLLMAKLSADVFWVAHYFLLGGYAGMIPNFVGIFRELVFIQRRKRKWAGVILWPILFILINWGLGIRTFHSLYNLLPITASTFVTVSLWIDNPRLTKLISAPVSLAFLTYDVFVGSYIGIVNESIAICSIILSFIKEYKKGESKMNRRVFSSDVGNETGLQVTETAPITEWAGIIPAETEGELARRGDAFAREITEGFLSDYEKPGDRMAHVSTFLVLGDTVYMTYYANTHEPLEDPKNQTARLVYAPIDDQDSKVFLDLQTTGDTVDGKTVDMVYDTILMQKDADTLYILWTARVEENYYRFYCPFTVSTKTLGKVAVNRFRVGDVTNDFSATGIRCAMAANGLPIKKMYSDIGIMQKLSTRMEGDTLYYYTGAYSGDFTCIIKSSDLITWEYVSQPDFINESQWENATYVIGDKCYYFVRQLENSKYGFLTVYDLKKNTWEKPVLIEDCQSRGDFILYRNELYLFHAPTDREHIGVVKINTECIAESRSILQAKMDTSCFYPFIQYYRNEELAMSYTVAREHIRLASFKLSRYL